MKLGYLFSLYEVWSSTCSQLGNCSKRSVQRKRRKCLQWFLSACAFQDKQPIDCMTFPNTSFYEASTGRISFQPILVGWGEVISYNHCRGAGGSENQLWGSLYKNWIFKLIQLFFILFLFFFSCALALRQKKPLFKPVKLIWSINIEVNKQIKTGIFACYSRLLKAFYIDFCHVLLRSSRCLLFFWKKSYNQAV